MGKKVTFLFLFLFSFVLVSGLTFKQGDCANIVAVSNSSEVNLSSVVLPNGTINLINAPMTKNGVTHNYSFCSTELVGDYVYNYNDADNKVYQGILEITYSGKPLDLSRTLVYIYLIILVGGLGFFLLWLRGKLPMDKRDEENRLIQISWLKHLSLPFMGLSYLCFTAVVYISGLLGIAYLGTGIGNILYSISWAMFWGVFVFVIIFFFKIFDDVYHDIMKNKDLRFGITEDEM